MQHILGFSACAICLAFYACNPSAVDDTAPEIEITTSSPTPYPDSICNGWEPVVFHVEGGSQLTFEARITDDVALSQFKIDIHSNYDCHGHKLNTEDWAVLEVGDIQGKEYLLRRTLQVPANVTAGDYHFQIQALDKAGNGNPELAVFAIKVTNPVDDEPPVLTITSPDPAEGVISLRKGQEYTFTGFVSDNHSLWEGGNGRVEFFYRSGSSGNTFSWGEPRIFTVGDGRFAQFSIVLRVPPTLVAGNYTISAWAYDGVRNVAKPVVYNAQIIN
jgi:hypothetical protein